MGNRASCKSIIREEVLMIKCVGCFRLKREEIERPGKRKVFYNCPLYFPYLTTIGGLVHPGKRLVEAVRDCPELTDLNCIIGGCLDLNLTSYGADKIVFICMDHHRAWGKWLDAHPGKREYFSPRGRPINIRFVEVFREFIEDMRKAHDKGDEDGRVSKG
jgi:hypothetical protein